MRSQSQNSKKRGFSQVENSIEMQARINFLEAECSNLKYENSLLKDKIQPLNNQMNPLKVNENYQQNVNGNLMNNLYNVIFVYFIDQLLDEKQIQLSQVQQFLNDEKNQRSFVTVIQERALDQISDKNREIERLKATKESLLEEIRNLKHQNDQLQLQHKQEGMFQVELEHLRSDNSRLLKLLNQNNKNFSNSDGMRFLKDIASQQKCEEVQLWVPEKAFQFANQFKLKYNLNELSNQHIELLLFEINKIYSQREQAIIKQIKSKYNFAKKSIEKNMQPKLDEFEAMKTINRLKTSLRDARQENIELNSNKPLTIKIEPVKPQARTSSAIRARRDSFKEQSSNQNVKQQFIDGAIWMNNRIDKIVATINDSELIKQLRTQIRMFKNEAANLAQNV